MENVMSIFTIDGVTYDLDESAHKQGLFVLMDRLDKTLPKGLLMINEAPVMITEYISGDVHPMQEYPDIQYSEELATVVQVIHTSAFVRMMHEFRDTEFTILVAQVETKKLNDKNTIQVDMDVFKSALRKLHKKKN
jgi:hypothetical protein